MSVRQSHLPRSTPEAQGIASSAIAEFIRRADAEVDHLHSVMLLRRGAVVAEGWWAPYAPQHPHVLFSLSKSFTSTAIGLAVHEGLLSIDDRVASFFPDRLPALVSENLAAMRVHDLLSMATGHAVDTTSFLQQDSDGDWVRAFLARPVEHAPGTHFVYNSGATYMLSAILHHITGRRLLEFLTPRLFEPLGIVGATWDQDPRGIDVGGWGLNITTEDIAHFGQLYLQKGRWNGVQTVPSDWVAAATSTQIDNAPNEKPDWAQGYGYQFWRCRHGGYRGDGAFGQYCIVLPDQDAVIAITSGVGDMQQVLNLIWDTLLPAYGPAALPEDAAAQSALRTQLASLQMPRPQGTNASPLAARIAGRRFVLDANSSPVAALSIEFDDHSLVLHMQTKHGDDHLAAGFADWRASQAAFTMQRPMRSAGAAAWLDDHTLHVALCMYETPFVRTHVLRFSDDGATVEVETKLNVGFGPTEAARVKGSVK